MAGFPRTFTRVTQSQVAVPPLPKADDENGGPLTRLLVHIRTAPVPQPDVCDGRAAINEVVAAGKVPGDLLDLLQQKTGHVAEPLCAGPEVVMGILDHRQGIRVVPQELTRIEPVKHPVVRPHVEYAVALSKLLQER
jgi:hypothetical protein